MVQSDNLLSTDLKLRVLMVTPRFFPFSGGVENHVYQVSTRMACQGFVVTVLTADPQGTLPINETLDGVQVLRARAWPPGRDYYFAPDIYRIIRRGKWDIVHIQSYHTLVPPVAMLAALKSSIPYVLTFHGGGSSIGLRNSLRRVQRTLLRPLLTRAVFLVALANFEIGQYGRELRVPHGKFVLIPNGADLPVMTGGPPSNVPGKLIVSVGRLEKYKGHHKLITALPLILAQQPDVRVRIVGSGPYESDLQRLVDQLNLNEVVEIGSIPPSDDLKHLPPPSFD